MLPLTCGFASKRQASPPLESASAIYAAPDRCIVATIAGSATACGVSGLVHQREIAAITLNNEITAIKHGSHPVRSQ